MAAGGATRRSGLAPNPPGFVGGTAKPDHIEADIRRISVLVGGAQTIWGNPGGKRSDGSGFKKSIGVIRRAAAVGAVIRPACRKWAGLGGCGTGPGVAPPVADPGGKFPFGLGRQALATPRAIDRCVAPGDLNHRMIHAVGYRRGRPVGVAPVGAGDGAPSIGPDIAFAGSFRIRHMTGCPDKFGKFTVVTSRANIRNGATVTWRSVSFESPAESPIRNVPPGMPVRGAGCADTGTVARNNTKRQISGSSFFRLLLHSPSSSYTGDQTIPQQSTGET